MASEAREELTSEERSPRTVSTVIFDMDDLMIDSHPIHMQVFEAVLNKYGASLADAANPLSRDEETRFFGLKISDIFRLLAEKYHLSPDADVEEMAREFDSQMISVFKKSSIKPMPGLIQLIRELREQEYNLVLASSARREKIEVVLRKLGLRDSFQAIVSGEDEIRHGKPEPDIFLKAAEKVRVDPGECVVLEDVKNGVEAAKTAGMYCIGVHNRFAQERLGIRQDLSGADLEIGGLEELSLGDIDSLNQTGDRDDPGIRGG